MVTKVCSKCGRELPVSDYHKSSKSLDGYQAWCKDCRAEYRKIYYKENRKVEKQKNFKRLHGVGLVYKSFLLASQGFRCELCGKVLKPHSSDACLDHSHRTGDIRAVLCRACNTTVSRYGDEIIEVSKSIIKHGNDETRLKRLAVYDYLLKVF